MPEVHYTFPAGKKETEIQSLTLVNNTAKTVDITVPTAQKWLLLHVKITNPDNVARSCTIDRYLEAAKTHYIERLTIGNVGAGAWLQYPNNTSGALTDNQAYYPIILNAAETLELGWGAGGASAGGTDADGIVVEYLRLYE